MSGAVFSRLHTWGINDDVTSADLNAEFNNILNNLDPSGVGGWSNTVTQMRATTPPSESALAASLSAEIQELRYQLQALAGAGSQYWYSGPVTDLTQLKNAIGGSLANNRIISGTASTLSSRSRFLLAAGSTAAVTVKATTVPLQYAIAGTIYSITADIVVGGISTASGTNNTMIVNDSSLSGGERSTWIGESGTILNVTSMGTGIQALVGSLAGFVTANSEYFIGYVASNTQITNCYRGFFFNSSGNPVVRAGVSNGDTFTLQNLVWLFANTTAGVVASYTNPKFQYATPSGVNGLYWYDITNQVWKTFGSSWQTANATLIGCCLVNTANCVAARAFDYYSNTDTLNTIQMQYNNTAQITSANNDAAVAVGANTVRFQYERPVWDLTANLESGAMSASTTYWAYVGENGQMYFSKNRPYDNNGSLKGYYHPYEMWRAVGSCLTNATPTIDANTVAPLVFHPEQRLLLTGPNEALNLGLSATVSASAMVVSVTRLEGSVPDPINYIPVSFGTPSVGTYATRLITAPLNITVPSGASLGLASGMNQYVWVYLIDNAGTVDIGVSGDYIYTNGVSGTAAQIANSANTQAALYSNAAYTGKTVRLVGRLLVNEPTAGQWTVAPSEVLVDPKPQATITLPINYTPTVTALGNISAVAVYSWRVGKFLYIQGGFANGVASGSGATLTVGYNGTNNNVNIDNNNMSASGSPRIVGGWATSAAQSYGWMLATGLTAAISFGATFTPGAVSGLQTINGNVMVNTSNQCPTINAVVPIVGWTTWSPP